MHTLKIPKYSSSFSYILRRIAKQSAEENLRIAFDLWQFANDLQAEGIKHDGKRKSQITRTTS